MNEYTAKVVRFKSEYLKSIEKYSKEIRLGAEQADKVLGNFVKGTNRITSILQSVGLNIILKIFFGFLGFDYFNIKTTKQKVVFWILTLVFDLSALFFGLVAFSSLFGGVAVLSSVLIKGISTYIMLMFALAGFLLPKYIVGKTGKTFPKPFMIVVALVFSIVFGGVLGMTVLNPLLLASWATLGMAGIAITIVKAVASALILVLTATVTFGVLWQVCVGFYDQYKKILEAPDGMQKRKAKMDMVQSVISTILIVFSVIAPFIGVTAFASIPLIGGFFALFATNSLLGGLVVFAVAVIISLVIMGVLKIISWLAGTSYDWFGWNRALRTNFKKFDEIEKNGSFLPDGRSWREEMKKFINMCTALSSEERDQFISALNGTGSKYPYPKDLSARKQIIKTIESYWARKPIQFEYDAQPTMGVYVMAGSGEYKNNIEYLLKNKTYFGLMAQKYPQEWNKVLDAGEQEIENFETVFNKVYSDTAKIDQNDIQKRFENNWLSNLIKPNKTAVFSLTEEVGGKK